VVPDTVFSVTVTSDDNLAPYLVVRREGSGSLLLGLAGGYNYVGVNLSAEVHMAAVGTIDASGASRVRLDPGLSSTDPFTVVLSGASAFDAPSITAEALSFDLSGASEAWVDVGDKPVALSASGASTLYYGGTPWFISRDLSGASRTVKVR